MCLLQEKSFYFVLFFFSFWKFTELSDSPEELKWKYETASAKNSGLRKVCFDDWFPPTSFFQILVVRHNRQSFYPATHTLVCSILFYSLFLKCLTHKTSRSLRQHSTVWKTATYPLFWKPRMCIWSDPTPRSGFRTEGDNLQVTPASTLAGQWPSFWQAGQLLSNDTCTARPIKRPPVIQRLTQEQYWITSLTPQHDEETQKQEALQKGVFQMTGK